MAVTTYKVLGQSNPAAGGIQTILYAVPAGRQAVCSSIFVNDVGNNGAAFSISVAINGAADNLNQYIYGSPTNGLSLDAGDTFTATVGLTLAAGDVVRVITFSSNANEVTFQMFGSEL